MIQQEILTYADRCRAGWIAEADRYVLHMTGQDRDPAFLDELVAKCARDGRGLVVIVEGSLSAEELVDRLASLARGGVFPIDLRADLSLVAQADFVEGLGRLAWRPRIELVAQAQDHEEVLMALPGLESAANPVCWILPLTRSGLPALDPAFRRWRERAPATWVRLDSLQFRGGVTEFMHQSLSIEQLREILPGVLSMGRELDLLLSVLLTADLPLCTVGPELGLHEALWREPAPLPSRSDRIYGESCRRCLLSSRCPGLSTNYSEFLGDQGTSALTRKEVDASLVPEPEHQVGTGGRTRTWEDRVRDQLVDHPDRTVLLSDIIPMGELPYLACVLPWTRLELFPALTDTERIDLGREIPCPPNFAPHTFGPCCPVFVREPQPVPPESTLRQIWNAPQMQAFRQSMLDDEPTRVCMPTCPHLLGGTARVENLYLEGGSTCSVELQIQRVRAILERKVELDVGPEMLQFPATSFCNYDCVMCEYGQEGSLDDELSDLFYEQVADLMPGLKRITISSGGEPFASQVFQRFLEQFPFSSWPKLELTVVTNGSLLNQSTLRLLERVSHLNLVISLNAATPETYELVNRGLPFERIQEILKQVLERYRSGRIQGSLAYSMVLLRSNHHEVVDFCKLVERDGVGARLVLPYFNRNQESIMVSRQAMEESLASIESVLRRHRGRSWWKSFRDLFFSARLLRERLDAKIFSPLP